MLGQNRGSPLRKANQVCAVICTRNRPEKLRRALSSLVAQVQPPAQILVVDNAPVNDASRKLVTEDFPSVDYV
ncbi:MAG: glycosyltransferase, partial [bacterium]|nr:glycosyltransferase [bacterium]